MGSSTTYCTVMLTSTMFSSSVSISAWCFLDRTWVTLTLRTRSISGGFQCRPGMTMFCCTAPKRNTTPRSPWSIWYRPKNP